MHSPEEWDRFFAKLAERGNITDACRVSGIARALVYEYVDGKVAEGVDAKIWKAKFDEAKDVALDRLESVAFERAHDGVDEPLIGRVEKDRDGVVATAKRYSDALLMFLLKAHRPAKYKDRVANELSGPDGKPIQTENKVIVLPVVNEKDPE